MDDFFERPHRKEIFEINLVPVIDMLTTVIFFLLLSTVFIAFNKLTVPPSKVSTITNPVAPPPLAATILVAESAPSAASQTIELRFNWGGKEPGQVSQSVSIPDLETTPALLLDASKKLADEFHKKYPDERTIRVGLERTIPYQSLISVMDGIRESLPDLVLISYDETEQRWKGTLH
jgi:biopolymer transport protein ExbD